MSIISTILLVFGLTGFVSFVEYRVEKRKETIDYQCRWDRRAGIGCYKNEVCYRWNGYWWYPTKENYYLCRNKTEKK